MSVAQFNDRLAGGISEIIEDLDEEIYHNCAGVSQTDLKIIEDQSLEHYRDKRIFSHESEAFKVGKAIHKIILENHLFEKEYTHLPAGLDKRTKAGRQEYQEIMGEGKIILSHDQFEICQSIKKRIDSRPKVKTLLEGGKAEISMFHPHNELIHKKARIDCYRPGLICDLKSTRCAKPSAFEYEIFRNGYHVQAAYYIDITKEITGTAPRYFIVAVEKSRPWGVTIHELSPKVIAVGRLYYQRALKKLETAIKENDWPCYREYNYVKAPKYINLMVEAEK